MPAPQDQQDHRDSNDPNRGGKKKTDALEEFVRGVFIILRNVLVDDMSEDEWIEERECLIDSREKQCESDQFPILAKIRSEKFHLPYERERLPNSDKVAN